MQFLKRLFGREEKQPERKSPRPHIKKRKDDYYVCGGSVKYGCGEYYVIGVGKTPYQAYRDWRAVYLNGEF